MTVDEELTPRGLRAGLVNYSIDGLHLTSASQVESVIADRGGAVPVLLVATVDGQVLSLLELADDSLKFAASRAEGLPRLGTDNLWLLRGFESGDFVVEVAHPIDPGTPTFCQDPFGSSSVSFEPGEDVVADWVAFAQTAWETAEFGPLAKRRALLAQAEEAASSVGFVDAVTGRHTSGWSSDVVDQALRGVAPAEWSIEPTVSVFVDVGKGAWISDESSVVTFVESRTGRLLGWSQYFRDADREDEVVHLEVMAPPESGDVDVFIGSPTDRIGCVADLAEPVMTIPFDDFAGSNRARVDLDRVTFTRWSP